MIRTVIFFFVVWISLLLSLFLFIPVLFMIFPFQRSIRHKYIGYCTRTWSKLIVFTTGSKIISEGNERIPKTSDFVIVSNHQGNMDIPILMTIFPYPLSFVAKKELLIVPFINLWLFALNSIIINRKQPIKAYRKIEEKLTNRYNPLILFPEGTRSKGIKSGKPKEGGLKLVRESGKTVVNVKISGSYKIWESKGKIVPAEVRIVIE